MDSIDDLQTTGDLELYIERSQCVLLFLSRSYFQSKNCHREVVATFVQHKSMVMVHEPDAARGGAPLLTLRAEFMKHVPHDDPATAAAHATAIFDEPDNLIPWYRASDFQLHSLRLIAERMLWASNSYARPAPAAFPTRFSDASAAANVSTPATSIEAVEVPRSPPRSPRFTIRSPLKIRRPLKRSFLARSLSSLETARPLELYVPGAPDRQYLVLPRHVRVYVSVNNPGATAFYADLETYLGLKEAQRDRSESPQVQIAISRGRNSIFSSPLQPSVAVGTSHAASSLQSADVTHMLLYLNADTFSSDEAQAAALGAEVQDAMQRGVNIVLVHECDRARRGCDFKRFFEVTPPHLIAHGLYAQIAVPCHASPHRQVSLALTAQAFGAEDLDAKRCFETLLGSRRTARTTGTRDKSDVGRGRRSELMPDVSFTRNASTENLRRAADVGANTGNAKRMTLRALRPMLGLVLSKKRTMQENVTVEDETDGSSPQL